MGLGTLKRIAALCTLGTLAVMAAGAMNVGAALTLPSTDPVTNAVPQSVTVPSTTVTVPSTTTTVTTPPVTVQTPDPPAPPPTPSVPKPSVPSTSSGGGGSGGSSSSPPKSSPVKNVVDTVTNTAGSLTSDGGSGGGGGGGGSPTKTVSPIIGSVLSLTGTRSGSSGPAGSAVVTDQAGRVIAYVPGGDSGPGGGPGIFGGGPGAPGGPGGLFFGSGGPGSPGGGGPGSLSAMLAGADSAQLHAALEQLAGCMPALPILDRRVLSMRAGLDRSALSRSQVASRLGMSQRAIRRAERRGLDRLQYAAQTTGCATLTVGPFDPAGIGSLIPQLALSGAVPGQAGVLAGAYGNDRGIQARAAEPLFNLGDASKSGPAWAIVLFTVLFSVAMAALMRELRSSF
jgi:hypothetical protein